MYLVFISSEWSSGDYNWKYNLVLDESECCTRVTVGSLNGLLDGSFNVTLDLMSTLGWGRLFQSLFRGRRTRRRVLRNCLSCARLLLLALALDVVLEGDNQLTMEDLMECS